MTLSLLVLLLIGVIAYGHYLMGAFSATLSAFCAIIAAVLAVSWHESVIFLISPGSLGDIFNGITLCTLFALIYLILRYLFDLVIPANVRVPLIADRILGPAMGIVAGIFAGGIVVLALESL